MVAPQEAARQGNTRPADPDRRAATRLRRLVLALAAALAAGTAAPVLAQQVDPKVINDPQDLSFLAELGRSYDSNVTRKPSAPDIQASWIDHTAVGAAYNLGEGPQHLYVRGRVAHDGYESAPLYTSTANQFSAGWNAEYQGGYGGGLHLDHGVTLSNQADFIGLTRNLVTRDEAGGWFHVPIAGRWNAVAAFDRARTRNSDQADQAMGADSTLYAAGVGYYPDQDDDANLLLRNGSTHYPDPGAQAAGLDDTRDQYADLNVRWHFAGSSTLTGRVGYQRHEYTVFTFRNASGPSFDLGYAWKPGGHLSIKVEALRAFGSPGDNLYLSAITTQLNAVVTYAVSGKLDLAARWNHEQDDFSADLQLLQQGQSPAVDRHDTTELLGLGATWKPRDWLVFESDVHHERRSSNLGIWSYQTDVILVRGTARW